MSDKPQPPGPIPHLTAEQISDALAALDVRPGAGETGHDRIYLLGVLLAVIEASLFNIDRLDAVAINKGYSEMLDAIAGGDERERRAAWTIFLKQRIERTGLSLHEAIGGEKLGKATGPALYMVSNILATVNRPNLTSEHVDRAFASAYNHLEQSRQGLDELRAYFREVGGV